MANTIETMAPEALLRSIIDGSLTELVDDTMTGSLQQRKLSHETNMTRLCLPSISGVNDYAIASGTTLSKIDISNASNISQYGISGLKTSALVLKKNLTGSQYNTLNVAVPIIDMFSANSISNNYFNKTTTKTLIIRKTSGVQAVIGNSVSGWTGLTLYVPSALIDDYTRATNWSTVLANSSNQILSIEGSEYEHYYADGTPIEIEGGGTE